MKDFKRHILISLFLPAITLSMAYSLEDTIAYPSLPKNEKMDIKVALKPGIKYSLADDNFQGGRVFDIKFAAIVMEGKLEKGFSYFVKVNMANEPNLLDAYIKYTYSEQLIFSAGAMKPKQTLDFIPDAVSTDFAFRAKITELLVDSREVGLSLEGDIGRFYYFSGLYNGAGLSKYNNNKFYGVGRLQYTFNISHSADLKVGVHGSHGHTPGVRSGSYGPVVSGDKTLFGSDFRLETGRLLLAAEYSTGLIYTEDDNKDEYRETISGYFFTAGYSVLKYTQLLGRWQGWAFKEKDLLYNQYTLGINQKFSKKVGAQLNFDSYLPDKGDHKSGFSLALKVTF